ncbi:hypothetical protein [Microbacterium imperiale]|uniref:Uncharacterized protein n=1 Tax=Microbacterium imperiale TaxID=33884 RepID=A0A9W6HI05_9MICO|nr:hypothetical protein [Microbacterium imperiale]MBP2421142.1 hypothetical protein [Microbacterium imperiale]MDS0199746.1 hypothetical protein [Microbacterium imperiale]BFE41482.1 hypothetical protein GCM10017544_24380 [Microbacterium imperiale]GLJ80433.1 hypothetical protein GCM10017586_21160 [Microbacterium imperiale]
MTAATSRRPLIILGIVAGVLLIAALVVFVLLQRGAQPAAAPSSPSPTASASATATATPTPAPTPTSTSTPTDAVPRAAEVVMAATGFTIIDDDGSTLLEFRWRDEVGPVVAALTAAFGAEPELDVQPGDGTHFPDYTVYDWAGFTLYDMIVVEGDKPRDEYNVPTWASIRANEVNGVAIQPEFGLAVGSPVDAIRASGPDDEWAMPGEGAARFVFDIDRTSELSPDGPVEQLSYSVYVDAASDAGSDPVATDIRYRPHSEL